MSLGGANNVIKRVSCICEYENYYGDEDQESDTDVDIAIVKATNHVEYILKERHIRNIWGYMSILRPRAYVQYCLQALVRRFGNSRNWTVPFSMHFSGVFGWNRDYMLALTRARLNGLEMIDCGFASHFVPSKDDDNVGGHRLATRHVAAIS